MPLRWLGSADLVRIALAVLVPRSETGEGNAVKVLVLGARASKSADYPPLAGELMTTIEQDVRESRDAQPARSLGQVEGIERRTP